MILRSRWICINRSLTYRGVPDVDALIEGAAGQVFAVGAEGHAVDRLLVFGQCVNANASLHIPQSHCRVERGTVCVCACRGERECTDEMRPVPRTCNYVFVTWKQSFTGAIKSTECSGCGCFLTARLFIATDLWCGAWNQKDQGWESEVKTTNKDHTLTLKIKSVNLSIENSTWDSVSDANRTITINTSSQHRHHGSSPRYEQTQLITNG